MLNGILVLDKILGAPSRGCVNCISRSLGGKRQKLGHAGTLDTTASGTLVLLLGNATRLSESVMNLPKTYEATIRFGWETSTDDASGDPLSDPVQVRYDEKTLLSVLPAFFGIRMQTPPHVSAVRVDGVRAHKIARSGREPDISPRPVNVTGISYLGRTDNGDARILVKCHRGTYIRSLGRDIGRALGTGGHLTSLRRLNIGNYRAEKALPVNPQTPPTREEIAAHLLPVSTLAEHYYHYRANDFCENRLKNGLGVFLHFMDFDGPGCVPASSGIIVTGKENLCLGTLDLDCKGERYVVMPRANIPLGVEL